MGMTAKPPTIVESPFFRVPPPRVKTMTVADILARDRQSSNAPPPAQQPDPQTKWEMDAVMGLVKFLSARLVEEHAARNADVARLQAQIDALRAKHEPPPPRSAGEILSRAFGAADNATDAYALRRR